MQITIDVPDTLPQDFLNQRVKEIEQSFVTEALFFTSLSKQKPNKIKRRIGGEKGLIINMPDDFNEPLDDFEDYMR